MIPKEILKLAENIYEGLSEEDIAEIEKVMLDRSNFISKERTERLQKILDEVTDENLTTKLILGNLSARKFYEKTRFYFKFGDCGISIFICG